MEEKSKIQYVNILNRERIDISGVLEVISSTDKEIYVRLDDSVGVVVGEKMTITKLVPESAVFLLMCYLIIPEKRNQIPSRFRLLRFQPRPHPLTRLLPLSFWICTQQPQSLREQL